MAELKRWKTLDNVYIVVVALAVFFAWMDVKQITTFFVINTEEAWLLYNSYTGPAIWNMWSMVFLVIGLIWYLITKDKSEAIALVAGGWALEWFGSQDLFYFLFSSQAMTDNMCWANGMAPIKFISQMLGECCPSAFAFMLSGIIGFIVSYKLFQHFKVQKW